jgi:hypothetical protein
MTMSEPNSSFSGRVIAITRSEKQSKETLFNTQITVVAIGPITALALNELDINVDVMPEEATFEKAVSALSQHWNKENTGRATIKKRGKEENSQKTFRSSFLVKRF